MSFLITLLPENRKRPDIEARVQYAKRELELRDLGDLYAELHDEKAVECYVAANRLHRLQERGA